MADVIEISPRLPKARCPACFDRGWVCEVHQDKPSTLAVDATWACGCGAAAPCPHCMTPSSAK